MLYTMFAQTTNTTIMEATEMLAITGMFFTNTGTDVESITVHLVPKDDVAQDSNTLIKNVPLVVDDTFECDTERFVLSAGDKVVARSLYGSVACTITAMPIS